MNNDVNENNTDKLDQAKDHIKAAFSIFTEYCESEMPKVVDDIKSSTTGVVKEGTDKMLSGINKSIESAEEGLSELKEYINRFNSTDDDTNK